MQSLDGSSDNPGLMAAFKRMKLVNRTLHTDPATGDLYMIERRRDEASGCKQCLRTNLWPPLTDT
jgi:hypothetical protein